MISGSFVPLTVLISAWLPLALQGQPAQPLVSVPSLGFVYDAGSHSLKPLLGNPAAAMIGPALDVGVELTSAVISPKQDYALAVTADRSVVLVLLDEAAPRLTALGVLPPGPDRLVLSPAGDAALLYYAGSGSLQIISGLPGAPVYASIDGAALAGSPDALAVSDDGRAVLAAISASDGGKVYLLTPGGRPAVVLEAGRVAAMAFLTQSQDALVADATANQLVRLSNVSGDAAVSILARQADGVAQPVAVAASADRRAAVVANAGSASVAVVDLARGSTKVVACQCVPTTLTALRGLSLFRLNELSDQAITLLDNGGSSPLVEIIPPEAKAAPEARVIAVPERGGRQ